MKEAVDRVPLDTPNELFRKQVVDYAAPKILDLARPARRH